MGYEIFDDIRCITLEGNTARQNQVEETLKNLGINFTFYVAKKHPRGGRVGCFESHINIIREAYQKKRQCLLIFEDDVIPTPAYTITNINIATEFMKTNTDWELFQFGWTFNLELSPLAPFVPYFTTAPTIPHIYNFGGVLGHAYAISQKGMKRVLDTTDNLFNLSNTKFPHYDVFISKLFYKARTLYCFAPILFDQRWCLESDNEPKNNVIENIFRKFQCTVEGINLMYCISQLIYNRVKLLVVLIIILILILIVATK
jgi:hypothetical protein